jgi:hypothetical protein
VHFFAEAVSLLGEELLLSEQELLSRVVKLLPLGALQECQLLGEQVLLGQEGLILEVKLLQHLVGLRKPVLPFMLLA